MLTVLHEARKGPWTPDWLGESASRKPGGGVGGAFGFRRGRGHRDPRRFFSGTARRHHLFLKKRWWGRTFPQAQLAKSSRPRPRREPLAVSRITLPARGETPLSGDCGKTIPQTAFGGQLPLHKGAFYGAAAPRIEKSLDRTIKAFLWQREKDSNRLDAGSGNPAAVAAIHEVRVRTLAPKPDGKRSSDQRSELLPGSERRIRTLTNRVRVCRATLTQSR